MPRLIVLLFTVLCLAGCSAVTVGQCGPKVADFLSRNEHRSLVIHPQGCYVAWDQAPSPFEAERRGLLFCSETNPDSDSQCRVVATDHFLCSVTLKDWIQERREKEESVAAASQRKCDFGPPFEVRSAPGTEPPAVDATADTVINDALTAFGLTDYDPSSSQTILFGPAPESKSNWLVNEALKFIVHKDGKKTCVFRVAGGWDPRFKHFDTLFTVQLLGCFENSEQNSE